VRIQPRLVIVHGHHVSGTACLPGETIEQIYVVVGSTWIPLPLSPLGLIIVDLLARKRNMALSAAHIESLLRSDPFCVRLGANANSMLPSRINLARRSIKTYICRLRNLITQALRSSAMLMDPVSAVISERTELSNRVTYRLALACEFLHVN
jgi:hypothetical protein